MLGAGQARPEDGSGETAPEVQALVTWQPVTRGRPEVQGAHPEYPGLLRVRIPLEGSVTEEWSYYFLRPVGVGISLSMHPPELCGRTIRIRPPDDELECYVRHVDERIGAANERYESEVLPRLQEAVERRKEVERQTARRLRAAREVASEL